MNDFKTFEGIQHFQRVQQVEHFNYEYQNEIHQSNESNTHP